MKCIDRILEKSNRSWGESCECIVSRHEHGELGICVGEHRQVSWPGLGSVIVDAGHRHPREPVGKTWGGRNVGTIRAEERVKVGRHNDAVNEVDH